MLARIIHHPRKLLARRMLFQVHLWAGVLLSLYVVVISLSGSILVFQDEMRRASLAHTTLNSAHLATLNAVIANAHEGFPSQQLTYIGFPQEGNPWWTLSFADAHGKPDVAYADAASGKLLAPHSRLFIDWVLDLHVYLLAGQTGFVINCIAGIGLLLLAITGALLWWPGIKLWKRGLTIALRRGWKRTNYDLHNAVGIWTLAIVSWWGITAIYFLFPAQVRTLVNAVSPLVGMKEPVPTEVVTQNDTVVSLETILARLPPIGTGHLAGVGLPAATGTPITIYVDRKRTGDFSHRDIFTFDGHTGKLLTVWHYGENRTLGDWFLWLMHPLHFGTLWGLGVKIFWSFLGVGLSLLSVTGLLMYWNRKLRKLCVQLLEVEKSRS